MRLVRVLKPSDIEPVLLTPAFAVRWLLVRREDERRIRPIVAKILGQLQDLDGDFQSTVDYLNAVDGPLKELEAANGGLWYYSESLAPQGGEVGPSHRDVTIFVVARVPCVLGTTPLHLLGQCEAGTSLVVSAEDREILVLRPGPETVKVLDNPEVWCKDCYAEIAFQMDEYRRMFGAPSGEILEVAVAHEETVRSALAEGEGQQVEFKSSFFVAMDFDPEYWRARKMNGEHIRQKQREAEKGVTTSWLEAIASFLNTDGGRLLVGVRDNGKVCGIEADLASAGGRHDDLQRKVLENCELRINPCPHGLLSIAFVNVDGSEVCLIRVARSPGEHYLDGELKVRYGNRKKTLKDVELSRWIRMRNSR